MTALIILAAGSSSRLGQPKQKLFYRGKSLLRHAVEEGMASDCSDVVVVLGSNEESVRAEIDQKDVRVVVNKGWEKGMSSSIKCGINALIKSNPDISQAIVMLCDQPFVDTQILNKLIAEKQLSGKAIAACTYDNTLGTPVLFDRIFFHQLLSLEGQQGAKKLVFNNQDQVVPVPFPFGKIDIDTIEDYEKLREV
jgi:molybdenum cofactor cytidylyltransferase